MSEVEYGIIKNERFIPSLSKIIKKVNEISRDFLAKTKGIEFVYSSSSNSNYILKIEQELKIEQTRLNELKTKLKAIQNKIQSIVTQL